VAETSATIPAAPMNADTRDFISSVERLGWTYIGIDGRGHPRFHNDTTGESYSAPSTPSDWRSMRNCLAQLERLSGRKLPRPNAGHYRQRRTPMLDIKKSDLERLRGQEIDWYAAEAAELRGRFHDLAGAEVKDYIVVTEARKVMNRYEHIRRVLADNHRIIPSIESVTT
jgi:hypothetical protein